jgi:molybdate transport system substrate-binding protein
MKYIALFLLMSSLLPIQADVEVFAAASLTDALKEIAAHYEKETGDKIIFNFAASSVLDTQIKAGAPADIFFSADEAKMDDLAKQKLVVAESRKDILSNTLVIVVPSDSTAAITSTADLADPRFAKLALGQPESVPAGIYAKAYLTKIGIWDKVSARVVPMESVRAALAAVETGNAEAGIVYKTDAQISKKVKVAYEVPAADGPAITYPAALVESSKNAAAAKKFLDYLEAPASLKMFEKYGFIAKG